MSHVNYLIKMKAEVIRQEIDEDGEVEDKRLKIHAVDYQFSALTIERAVDPESFLLAAEAGSREILTRTAATILEDLDV